MSPRDLFATLFAYNAALYEKLWQSIMRLSDEQFVAEIPYSHGSIRNQIVHVAAAETRWLRGLQGDPQARALQLDPAAYPTREAAYDLWREANRALVSYVAALDEAAFDQDFPGLSQRVWHILAHLINHGTDHRAQILRALAAFGAPTFDQDLIAYLLEK